MLNVLRFLKSVFLSDYIHVYPTNDVRELFKGQVDMLKGQLDRMEQQYSEKIEDNIQLRLGIKELEIKA